MVNEIAKTAAEWCAVFVELIGIGIITLIALHSLVHSGIRFFKREAADTIFQEVRHRLGRGIILGLEFLVAADIIHTVAVELTFTTVGVLAIIVLIRTFLSFTLAVELDGKWPWQERKQAPANKTEPVA